MQRTFMALIVLSLLLSACGTLEVSIATPASENPMDRIPPSTDEPNLSMSSSSDEIQRAMLESATKWKSIWMDGTITQYAPDGGDAPLPVSREQVWIDLSTNRFRVLTGSAEGGAESYLACDGTTIIELDLKSGQSQSRPLPELSQIRQFVPTLEPGFAYPQPLWGQMGTRLSQLAFTSDFAQNEGVFKPVAIEVVAERETLAVEWTYVQNDLPSWRIWLDMKTAVILKFQEFGKGGGEELQGERVVNQVIFDDVFADSLFDIQIASLPQFSDVSGKPLKPTEAAPAFSIDDPLGEVYFFMTDHQYGNETIKLMRLPGSCAAGQSPCPEADEIPLPFLPNFAIPSLAWSRKGDAAAFSYPVNEDGNRTGLFLFDPEQQTWQSLAEFNYIDPPLWSPDGTRLAFRAQDGNGSDEIYAIHRDGTRLTNLSANEKLPVDGNPYVLNGWINGNVVLRGRNDMVFLLRVEDGFVKPLFDSPWAKSNFVPSPDGSFLAYFDGVDQKTILKLITPDGKPLRDLASFQSVSIYPIAWSPDGTQLAFAKTSSDLSAGQDVYVIGQDGRNLQQVYHSNFASINDLIFSPDGKYLLLHDDDATGRHVFVVNLSTLNQRMIQAPGLPLDWWWLMPSWRR